VGRRRRRREQRADVAMTRAIDVGKRVTVHDLDLACAHSLLDLAEQPGAGCPFGDYVRYVGRRTGTPRWSEGLKLAA
jgi:hypothetical protein